ncbi:hypothetical protein LSTR_LSTR015702 [Laodelphax striatellus]|uniref:Uncharacterized protein n=1 Tax=Laodelphax striatellus TaxID=195883 RepID=A0A482XTE8_LAOST|nr:hypothetical protein LSTR_LSTR015702 [Laodelphax striatellus]
MAKLTFFCEVREFVFLESSPPQSGSQISDVTFREVDEHDFDDDSSIYKHGHDYADNFNKTGTPSQSAEQQTPAFKRARLDESSGGGKGDSGAPVGHFANYISAKLESYSARTRAAVEHAISNLLFVADLGQFDYLGQLPREKGSGGGGNGGGGSGPPQRTNTNSNAQQQRSQSSTPVPAAPGPRSSKVTRASAAAAAAAASSSQQAEHERVFGLKNVVSGPKDLIKMSSAQKKYSGGTRGHMSNLAEVWTACMYYTQTLRRVAPI